ncbi:MAG TPA: hypothetical protein VLW50_05560 [Streptosporangiaceae bacterium]|nr:hypothetical protein [Streptosporangiaceae bacterium]
MITGRKPSREAMAKHAADVALAAQFAESFRAARDAEDALRQAQASRAPLVELRERGLALDDALTAVMRSAYAAERVEIGAIGYDDWIYRRKARAKPKVKRWTAEAERLLTLREEHRLKGIVRVPPHPADWASESLAGT